MNFIRIVIAQHSIQQLEYLSTALSAFSDLVIVGAVCDGLEALSIIQQTRPQVVVCDMQLPRMSGFALLEKLCGLPIEHRPYVIGLGVEEENASIRHAYQAGVADYMIKPVHMQLLYMRILQLIQKRDLAFLPSIPEQDVLESEYVRRAGTILIRMGMPAHLNGYRFLKQAIALTVERPERLQNITHDLYPLVAQASKTTSSRVERDIRNAINVTWDRGGRTAYAKLLRCPNYAYKPSNGELIATVAERIRTS